MTDIPLYKLKNDYLKQFYEEVSSQEFYRDVFPKGSFERKGHPEDKKANGVLTVIEGEKAKNYVVFDELEEIAEQKGKEFVILSAVSYSGRNRTAQNARWLYGITIDLDGVEIHNLRDVLYQAKNGILPQPTYIVNSGYGLHLYYLFEKPVPLYRHLQEQLRGFKYELIAKIWNRYTSTYTEREQVQYQGIFQGFRMVGSPSKLGKKYPVRAFLTGEKVTVEYLNVFLIDKSKAVTNFHYKSELSLEQAKEKYPDWYNKRIVQKEKRGRWHVNRALYDWWLKKIREGASVGHRYSCLSVLATYAVKCDIEEDELISDALELLPVFDEMSDDQHNRFTKRDVLDAMKLYTENYVHFSREEAERVSGIVIPPNKRNGLKQTQHLYLARRRKEDMKAIDLPMKAPEGRPSKKKIVEEWRKSHPHGIKAECIKETGLSKPTVYKWWDKTDKAGEE